MSQEKLKNVHYFEDYSTFKKALKFYSFFFAISLLIIDKNPSYLGYHEQNLSPSIIFWEKNVSLCIKKLHYEKQ